MRLGSNLPDHEPTPAFDSIAGSNAGLRAVHCIQRRIAGSS